VVPEVTLGKRCARLDLENASDRQTFEQLLSQADILLHGYRPGALDRIGYDPAPRAALQQSVIFPPPPRVRFLIRIFVL
jgi:crotonobetainyl-CoA:carnitine CoA-transferase CaiB-like acyl-CoA transferase